VEAGAGITDLGAGHHRDAVPESGGGGRAAGALRDVLVDLAFLVAAGPEPLDRSQDHARVLGVDLLPGQTHPGQRPGSEVLDEDVAFLDQAPEHLLALRVLRIERQRALVVVQHREIEAVHIRNVLELLAGGVADPGPLDLDHVRSEPGQELGAGRAGLNVGEVQDADAFKGLAHGRSRISGRVSGFRVGRRFRSVSRAPRHSGACAALRPRTRVWCLRTDHADTPSRYAAPSNRGSVTLARSGGPSCLYTTCHWREASTKKLSRRLWSPRQLRPKSFMAQRGWARAQGEPGPAPLAYVSRQSIIPPKSVLRDAEDRATTLNEERPCSPALA
jgi:hypothetical protein